MDPPLCNSDTIGTYEDPHIITIIRVHHIYKLFRSDSRVHCVGFEGLGHDEISIKFATVDVFELGSREDDLWHLKSSGVLISDISF